MTDRPLILTSEQVRSIIAGEPLMLPGPQAPGTRYWLREMIRHPKRGGLSWLYDADAAPVEVPNEDIGAIIRWARAQKRARIPASHMPRFASRFTILIGGDLFPTVYRMNIDRVAQ